jgi:anti-sigma factor RsiW
MDEDLLSAYVDGELDPATRAAVDERLATSGEWRQILAEVRTARDAVRALPVRDAPDGFWDDVAATIARDADVVSLDEQRAKRRRTGTRLAALAGAAAAAVIIAVSIVPSQDRARPPVGTFANAHAARSSLSNEPVSQLAGVTRTLSGR